MHNLFLSLLAGRDRQAPLYRKREEFFFHSLIPLFTPPSLSKRRLLWPSMGMGKKKENKEGGRYHSFLSFFFSVPRTAGDYHPGERKGGKKKKDFPHIIFFLFLPCGVMAQGKKKGGVGGKRKGRVILSLR